MALLEIPVMLTGWALIRLFSFGKWRCETFSRQIRAEPVPAGALYFSSAGHVAVTATGQSVTGLLFYIGLGLVAYWVSSN